MAARGSELELHDGVAPFVAYRSLPAGRPGPGVIVLHEGFGLDDCTREAADRLARAGFLALAPALDDRSATRSPAAADARAQEWSRERASARVRAAVDELLDDEYCDGARIGMLGAGIGGELALGLAGALSRVGAAVDFGGLPVEPLAPRIERELRVLLVFGEEDPACADALPALVDQLRGRGCAVALRREPGVGAGFSSEARVDCFDARAAAQGWDAALAFLHAVL